MPLFPNFKAKSQSWAYFSAYFMQREIVIQYCTMCLCIKFLRLKYVFLQFPQATEEAGSLCYAMWQEKGVVGSK